MHNIKYHSLFKVKSEFSPGAPSFRLNEDLPPFEEIG